MSKFFALILITLSLGAHAAPPTPEQQGFINHMVSECSGVMGKSVCTVMISASQCDGAADAQACKLAQFKQRYPNGLIVAGAGRFTADEYFMYQGAAEKMCDVIVQQCSADYSGRGCLMARALWRQK